VKALINLKIIQIIDKFKNFGIQIWAHSKIR